MHGGFDVIVAEALDRLSRDQEHVAALYKRMRYLDVMIVTKADGEINEMHIGLGGTMNALFLRHLAQKTHRGLEGRVRAGKSAGGISYGYRLKRRPLADGSLSTGERSIDPAEAAIVQRIFRDYVHGKSAPHHRHRAEPRWHRSASCNQLHRYGNGCWRGLELLDDLGQLEARHRHPEQRTLYRPAGLEPAALREGSADRQAPGPAQSPRGLDHRGGAGAADHRRRSLATGQAEARGQSATTSLPRAR